MRDRTAAVILRAATTGGFDYRGADPYNKTWRVKHTLAMREITRSIEAQFLQFAHQHWLAYVGHSRLEPDSWSNAKTQAHEIVQELQQLTLPWQKPAENTSEKDTIEAKYGTLIQQYREMVATKEAERQAAARNNQTKENDNNAVGLE